MRENRIFVLLVLLIVVIGSLLRFWSIGSPQLSAAELPYHFAAQSIARGEGPTLPSGEEVRRGIPMVRVISALQGTLRDAESPARIPSAVFGTLALLLFAGFVWLIAGPQAAVAATFLFAFYPEAIRQSRTAGLYSFQQFCGVIALGGGWLATSQSLPQLKSTPADLLRRWIWAIVAGAAFVMAGLAHLSAGTVFVGFAVWVVLLTSMAIWIGGPRAILSNLAAHLLILGVFAGGAILLVKPGVLGAIRDKVASTPETIGAAGGSVTFFAEALGSQFGWVFTLLPLIALFTFRKYTWLTTYLLLWFIVPLIEHSFFIARKEERLMLMAVPALFMLAGLAVSEGRDALVRAINVHAREWLPSYRSAVRAAAWIASGVCVFSLVSLAALPISLREPALERGASTSDWSALRRSLEGEPFATSLPLGSSQALVSTLYLGRTDFTVASAPANEPKSALTSRIMNRFRPAIDSAVLERWSGVAVFTSLGAIREAYLPYGEVYIAIDSDDLESDLVDRNLRETLQKHGTELCRGQCGVLRLYRLRLID